MEDWVIGIDLGATKIALGLIDAQNRIVARQRTPTLPLEGPAAAVARMGQAVDFLKCELPADARITGVGICSPGPLDHHTGILLDPPNLTGWVNVPLRQMLSQQLGLPVTLEHDAKASALGEYHYGAGRGQRDMVYIVVGTGVGAALILDGQVRRGPHNSAGEVGHITIRTTGDLCACGNVGCVETFTAGPFIARHYARAIAAGLGCAVNQPAGPITAEVVAEQARGGDALALAVLADAGVALGTAVATLAMLLDVELYVIGSSVAKSGDLLLDPARRAVAQHAHQSVARRIRIVRSELEDDGPILGCGWLARQH